MSKELSHTNPITYKKSPIVSHTQNPTIVLFFNLNRQFNLYGANLKGDVLRQFYNVR